MSKLEHKNAGQMYEIYILDRQIGRFLNFPENLIKSKQNRIQKPFLYD
jgi:hypothetical protein